MFAIKRFNFRMTARQDNLIRTVAARRGMKVADFVRDSACAQAEQALADERHFSLPTKKWKAFTKALDRPAQVKPQLEKLFSEPSILEDR